MKIRIKVISPDGDLYESDLDGLPPSLSVEQLHWLVYGWIVDRNRKYPLGFDPNRCDVEIETVG